MSKITDNLKDLANISTSANGDLNVSGKIIDTLGIDLPIGHIGFNRNITNGVIYNSADAAYQISLYRHDHPTPNALAIEAYLGTGIGAGVPMAVSLDNNSKAQVLRPTLIAWSGQTTSFSGTITGGANHVTGYNYSGGSLPNGVLVNQGGAWNTSTGRVTIPITGLYQINIIGHKDADNASRNAIVTISVNGSYYEMAEQYGNYQDTGASILLKLSANDWVEAGRNYAFTSMSQVTFSGFLVG